MRATGAITRRAGSGGLEAVNGLLNLIESAKTASKGAAMVPGFYRHRR